MEEGEYETFLENRVKIKMTKQHSQNNPTVFKKNNSDFPSTLKNA